MRSVRNQLKAIILPLHLACAPPADVSGIGPISVCAGQPQSLHLINECGESDEHGHRIGVDPEDLASARLIGLGLLDGKTAGNAGRTTDVGPCQRDVDEAAGPGVLQVFGAVTPPG